MSALRLLLFPECDRNCKLCCNNQYDMDALPIYQWDTDYDQYVLTGGDPMLKPELVKNVATRIKETFNKPVFMYTAKTQPLGALLDVMEVLDGVTVTLHDKRDVQPFLELHEAVYNGCGGLGKSLWLNVFRGIKLPPGSYETTWNVKVIQWIKNCPLPQNETFMRLDPTEVGPFEQFVYITGMKK